MTVSTWLGVLSLIALAAFLVFAFRRGSKVKPDTTRRTEDWPRITQGGSN
jgi:hypothetical protein